MAATQSNLSWQLATAADDVSQPLKLTSLRWRVTGGTIGQRLIIKDKASGTILVDHLVEAATEDVEFLTGPRWVAGLYLDTVPAAGGGIVTAVAE